MQRCHLWRPLLAVMMFSVGTASPTRAQLPGGGVAGIDIDANGVVTAVTVSARDVSLNTSSGGA